MGANTSREMSVNDNDLQTSIPRSSTLPAGLKSLLSGGQDSQSFSVKLTKSKKLDGSPSKKDHDETNVEIVANEQEEGNEKQEIQDVEEETLISFMESLLSKVIEDTIESSFKNKMKKSSTLPSSFRGILSSIYTARDLQVSFFVGLGKLNRSHSFGKRIRQSFRKLVAAKRPIEEKTEDAIDEKECGEDGEIKVEMPDETVDVDESKLNTTRKSLQIPFKKMDFEAKKKQLQATLRKMVPKNKKAKKESIELINSIIEDIIKEVEGTEGDVPEAGETSLEAMWNTRDSEMFSTAPAEERVGVLDRSND